MTHQRAFGILAAAAIRDLTGAGCGYHSRPSVAIGRETVIAIKVLGTCFMGPEFHEDRIPYFQNISAEYLDTPATPGKGRKDVKDHTTITR